MARRDQREVPGDLDGRRARDRGVAVADRLLTAYFTAAAHRPRPQPTPPVAARRTHRVTVSSRALAAPDGSVVELGLVGEGLPRWHPGAHIDVALPSGRVRQYSLCGDPDGAGYRIAVRLDPEGAGGSREMHGLRAGAALTIGSPRNTFPFVVGGRSRARHVRFVAGGIGITPILPMLAAADAAGVDFSLCYLGRSTGSLAFLGELGRFGDRVTVRFDDEAGPPTSADLLGGAPDDAHVYACGPAPMLEAIRGHARARRTVGVHFERFAPPPVVGGAPFEIVLASDGTTVPVGPDETALAAVLASRPNALYSCRQGFCGTCRVGVLDGAPLHRGTALSPGERAGEMLLCVSRAAADTRVVIDL